MKATSLRLAAGGAALFALGFATSLVAQVLTDAPQRVEQKRADLSGAPGMEVIESVAEYRKGERVDLHLHHGLEAAYVVQGTMIQPDGKDPVMQPTGTVALNLRDVKHGGYTIVGETPLKLFTVHIVGKGAPLYDFQK
jgi:quercetin dioxygenase-like cupin family protein